MRAAISLGDGTVVADPFHRTAELVEMLRIRLGAVHNGSRLRPLASGRSRRGALARVA